MPPTTSVRSLLLDVKRISNPLHQHSKRQLVPPEQTVANLEPATPDTKTDTAVEAFAPYSPPSSLHAAILPSSTVSKPNESGPGPYHHPSTPTGEIAAIVVSIVFAGLLCILLLILALSRHRSKMLKTALKRIFAKDQPATTAGFTPSEGDLIIDICAKAGGRTQDMVYLDSESEKINEVEGSIETDISEGPLPSLRIPPSVSSEEYAALGYGVPNMAAFWSQIGPEEADVCPVTNITAAEPRLEFNSMANLLATRGSWDNIKNRTRQDSDASESTHETTGSNIFSIGATTCSSRTSVRRNGNSQEDMELEDDLNTEETAFEVARARTQSVEIKRGILINWGGELGGTSCEKFEGSTLPSVVVTCPSSLSSISVDLNEFPLPPDDFVYMVET